MLGFFEHPGKHRRDDLGGRLRAVERRRIDVELILAPAGETRAPRPTPSWRHHLPAGAGAAIGLPSLVRHLDMRQCRTERLEDLALDLVRAFLPWCGY